MEDRTKYRIKRVLARTKKLRRQRERHLLGALSALCLLLTVTLAGSFEAITGGSPIGGSPICGSLAGGAASAADSFGAMLLHEGAGGYVLVGVLAFAIGAAITVVCLWWHKKH